MFITTAVGPSNRLSNPSIPTSANALLVILFFITEYSAFAFLNSFLKDVTSATFSTLIPLIASAVWKPTNVESFKTTFVG